MATAFAAIAASPAAPAAAAANAAVAAVAAALHENALVVRMAGTMHTVVMAVLSFIVAPGTAASSLRNSSPTPLTGRLAAGTKDAARTADARVLFQAFVDTTCSDCQDWVLQQFLPLWMDPEARKYLSATYKFEVNAMSVTRHEQGPYLNAALLCAQQELGVELFFEPFFCWENNIEAWVPIPGTTKYRQAMIDVPSLLDSCFPKDSVKGIQACLDDSAQSQALQQQVVQKVPAGLDEVPYIVIGNTQNDVEAVHNLAGFVCSAAAGANSHSFCNFANASQTASFYGVKVQEF